MTHLHSLNEHGCPSNYFFLVLLSEVTKRKFSKNTCIQWRYFCSHPEPHEQAQNIKYFLRDKWKLLSLIFDFRKLEKPSHTVRYRAQNYVCVTSGFGRDVDEIDAVLGYYAAYSDNSVPKMPDKLSVPTSRVMKTGPIVRPVTSARNYHYKLRNFLEERRSQNYISIHSCIVFVLNTHILFRKSRRNLTQCTFIYCIQCYISHIGLS
jgi:hypothetical protein